jgi:hypothetical protein
VPAGAVGSVWASGSWSATAWEANVWADISAVTGNSILDLNTRIAVYLRAYYSQPSGDATSLVQRYLQELSGDYNARLRRLIDDATA